MQAIPAKPGLSVRTMPDGSRLAVRLVGDEKSHYWLTEDGHLIMPDASGYFCYATLDTHGKCVESTQRVSNLGQRNASELQFIHTINDNALMQALQQQQEPQRKAKNQSQKVNVTYPTTGEQRGIVVLVEYSDIKFTIDNPREQFYNMLNEQGYSDHGASGSARDWFIDNSMGNFKPTFDVYGPITLKNPRSYYGGGNDDDLAHEMVTEACDYLDSVVDFTEYDRDHDGYVDNVYVFYAGYGENLGGDAPAESVWPHSDDIAARTLQIYEHDGVRLNHYACSNEINLDNEMEGIGTFCHEFSHVLGLPDLYATDYSYAFTPGEWSVLDSGCYNNDSRTPCLYSAFERYSLGWLTPKEIGKPSRHRLDDISTNEAFIITTSYDNEYFILENRQQAGWDTYIPGHGMLIWHIDYNEAVWNTNLVNNKRSHQYVDIEEADGIQSDGTVTGDAFPGESNVTSFTDDTTPSMLSWDGSRQEKPITNISEKDGIITFTISGGKDELQQVTATDATDVDVTSFTANWTTNDDATEYLLSVFAAITLPSGKAEYECVGQFDKLNVGDTNHYTITGLSPATEYKYSVKSRNSDSGFESVSSNEVFVTTLDPTFEYITPQALEADDITASGFTAKWQAVPEATGYVLNVYKKEFGEPSTEIADFTGGLQELPQGWSTNSTFTYSLESYCGESAPSLRLVTSDSYIATATYADGIRAFQFWHRGANADATASLKIGAKVNDKWNELQSMAIVNDANGATTRIDQSQLPNQCQAISITYYTEGRGAVAIDDIKVEYGGLLATHPADGFENLAVDNVNEYTVSLPIADDTYYYTIQALRGEEKSLTSNEIAVRLPMGYTDIANEQIRVTTSAGKIIITSDSAATAMLFTTTGRLVSKCNIEPGDTTISAPESGIYLLSIGSATYKLIIR